MANKEVNRQELRVLRDTVAMRDLAAAYIESLTTIINTLENQEEVTGILDNLTDRHLPRGVLSLHFQVVRKQSIQTFLSMLSLLCLCVCLPALRVYLPVSLSLSLSAFPFQTETVRVDLTELSASCVVYAPCQLKGYHQLWKQHWVPW